MFTSELILLSSIGTIGIIVPEGTNMKESGSHLIDQQVEQEERAGRQKERADQQVEQKERAG